MRFAPFLLLASLATASPLLDTNTEVTDIDVVTSLKDLKPVAELVNDSNVLEARGSTPWHNCKCFNGYITDENYSGVYEKTLAYEGNWYWGIPDVPQGYGVYFEGPSKYFLTVEVVGKNSQLLTKNRVGNIIHQLKVARGDKQCGTKPVVCWTKGENEIKAYVKEF
ncbi:predicted protein [Aspergillus nidulans FGSC A4]|jgi:hypothetical protein|uniref:Uncharacterized protein n=1 Tax=Emericella nidulans (strain FGSC A4 / ATCC 38163 / CBS 112.46 / NRRL 194 / M139) TaxID=227321 RepID=Q5AWB4_EMENI|nr:hypothetical protein [Aspergillus nidulans FGSC A4]EAA61787.1 predicted protein [Aspergillus nidulans FGSC A4]CBF78421.1 TPA: conserved hypothetical protein [Aspergillus nidulans FGSC A4]|eukprot:XP_680685.1 predicted protein [Aspergillus nidulans FGSC A4]